MLHSLCTSKAETGWSEIPCPTHCRQDCGGVWHPGAGVSPWLRTHSPSQSSHCASLGCQSCSWESRVVQVRGHLTRLAPGYQGHAHSPLKGDVLGVKLCGDDGCSEPAQHLLLSWLGSSQQQLAVLPGQRQSLRVYHPAVMVNLHDHSICICQPQNSTGGSGVAWSCLQPPALPHFPPF